MIITRVSKGREHEIYNRFITTPQEDIIWSDEKQYLPHPSGNFKKESIIDDFIV